MGTSSLYDRLVDAVLELAWSQWTGMGVAGVRASRRTIIDPEALTLATLAVGRSDARLFDEMLDWVAANARLLDMARLRRLGRRTSGDQRRLLGVVAEVTAKYGARSSLRQLAWAGVLAQEEAGEYSAEPLFRSAGEDTANWASTDDLFERSGFLRSSPELRGMSRSPDAAEPACMRFRARALAGPGARAEVLTYLWTHEWAHGRLIAERAAYNQAPVAEYLSELADARLAQKRSDGRRTLYRLAGELRDVGVPAPTYVDWVRVWPALVALLDALRPAGLSEDAEWVRLAEVLKSQRDALASEGLDTDVGDLRGWADRGTESLTEAVGSVIAGVRRLAE
ncbi:MAG: hypothetical protein WC971_09485 [Coriobacteriia bacterium]